MLLINMNSFSHNIFRSIVYKRIMASFALNEKYHHLSNIYFVACKY